MASPSPRSAADHPKPHPAGDAWWCKRCEVAFYGESCPGRHAHFAHTEVLPLGVRAPEWALSLYPYPPNAGDPLPHGHLSFAPGANLTIIPWGKAAGERAPLFLCAAASALNAGCSLFVRPIRRGSVLPGMPCAPPPPVRPARPSPARALPQATSKARSTRAGCMPRRTAGRKGWCPRTTWSGKCSARLVSAQQPLRPRCRNSFRDHVLLAGPILGDTSCVQRDIGP